MVNSGPLTGTPGDQAFDRAIAYLEERGIGQAGGQLPPARLADLAPALLGRADPDGVLREHAAVDPVPMISCRCCCPMMSNGSRPVKAR